jgi:dUTP pyrophosphatase
MRVEFRKLDARASIPGYAHRGDAGLDLAANAEVVLEPGERGLVPTGLAVAIPNGHAGLVLPRSGLASRHGITLVNAPGLIDSGYRGEITIAVVNLDRQRPYAITRGERIAQLLVVPFTALEPMEVVDLTETSRGVAGFGSTGT